MSCSGACIIVLVDSKQNLDESYWSPSEFYKKLKCFLRLRVTATNT